MNLAIRFVLFALCVIFVSWIIPGISVSGFLAAILVSIVLGLINALVKPVIYFISLPINILTLGLFSFVINAFLLMLAGYITPGFSVDGFLSALLGSILLSILGIGVNKLTEEGKF